MFLAKAEVINPAMQDSHVGPVIIYGLLKFFNFMGCVYEFGFFQWPQYIGFKKNGSNERRVN
jgi:hypothetical protein